MKVCQRGWEYAQITNEYGDVEICSWASMHYKSIGRLTEQSMYDIWHGEAAEKFRESLADGSYCYCEKEKCPWMANGTLEKHMKEYDRATEYPKDLSISFQRNCNYTCTCCADNGNIHPIKCQTEENFKKISGEIEKFINSVSIISANGRGELFASKHIMDMLHNWEPEQSKEDIQVILETNGSMFDEKHWKLIENLGQYDLKVSITVMGFEEKTYQFLSGTKLPVQNLIDNLNFVHRLREQGIINDFEIGTVVQERNFREMPEFSRRCIEEFGVDRVRLRPYFPFGDFEPIIKWVYDIRNPYHPYYREYVDMLKAPIFNHPKVFMWSGDEVSPMGRNPYSKDKMNFDVIKYFAVDENIGNKLEKYFADNNEQEIVIYGMGYTGTALAKALLKTNIKVKQYIDRAKAGEIFNSNEIENSTQINYELNCPIIVTSPYFYEEIKHDLENKNSNVNVISIYDILSQIGDLYGC